VYPFAEVTVVTGVAPVTGAVTPPIAATETTVATVAGNTAVITPESMVFVAAEDVPATVKKLALTPVNVYPAAAVKVIVAV
jgi:hypothetical protein